MRVHNIDRFHVKDKRENVIIKIYHRTDLGEWAWKSKYEFVTDSEIERIQDFLYQKYEEEKIEENDFVLLDGLEVKIISC